MNVASITPQELAELIRSDNPPTMLDCREDNEWAFCRIEGACHIPMSQMRNRYQELNTAENLVVYCHHGVRSQSVAEFLVRQGFPRVGNLEGGIDAWSVQVDPDVPRY